MIVTCLILAGSQAKKQKRESVMSGLERELKPFLDSDGGLRSANAFVTKVRKPLKTLMRLLIVHR